MENVGDSIIVYGDNKNFNAVDVRTQVYPGFATDLQQPLTALLTQANGQSQVIETIYPENTIKRSKSRSNRFKMWRSIVNSRVNR